MNRDASNEGVSQFVIPHRLLGFRDVRHQGSVCFSVEPSLCSQERRQGNERGLQWVIVQPGFDCRPVQMGQSGINCSVQFGSAHSGIQDEIGANSSDIRRNQVWTADAVNGPALLRTS